MVVTGGAGFVGSHLCQRLIREGHEVSAVDDLSNGDPSNLAGENVTLIAHDISVGFPSLQPAAVIYHLAAFPRSMSFAHPQRDVDVNLRGTVNVLEFARRNGTRVIFSSNSGIYGTPDRLPIHEPLPDRPSTPYDIDKLAAEHFLRVYHDAFDLPVAIFRFATVYGSRQRVREDWKPVIAEFVTRLLRGERPTIFGDGRQTRDFIHVNDIVEALVLAAKASLPADPIILSSNTETTILGLYKQICQFLNVEIEPEYAPAKLGEVPRMWYDNRRARELLGWRPRIDLRSGILNDVIPYYRTLGGSPKSTGLK